MSPQRIFGIALLLVGIVLVIVGLNASDSMADQISNTFTGKYTDRTTWYILGGVLLAVVGVLAAVVPGGRFAKR